MPCSRDRVGIPQSCALGTSDLQGDSLHGVKIKAVFLQQYKPSYNFHEEFPKELEFTEAWLGMQHTDASQTLAWSVTDLSGLFLRSAQCLFPCHTLGFKLHLVVHVDRIHDGLLCIVSVVLSLHKHPTRTAIILEEEENKVLKLSKDLIKFFRLKSQSQGEMQNSQPPRMH